MPVEVLLIEDNAVEGRLVCEIAADSAIQVRATVATNCAGAVRIVSASGYKPSVVIADMSALEFGGVELLKVCNPLRIPVVVFSGSSNPADANSRNDLVSAGPTAALYQVSPFQIRSNNSARARA